MIDIGDFVQISIGGFCTAPTYRTVTGTVTDAGHLAGATYYHVSTDDGTYVRYTHEINNPLRNELQEQIRRDIEIERDHNG